MKPGYWNLRRIMTAGERARTESGEREGDLTDMIFDTHAHYDDDAFQEDREELLAGLAAAGVGTVVNVGASIASTKTTLALAERYPFIYAAVGVHPSETAEMDEDGMKWLEEMCAAPKTVAVGEIGLDYHWDEPAREVQKRWFREQIRLARRTGLPIIVHSRDAAKDTMDIIKEENAAEAGGVIHCFSYGVEVAREYLDMGFYIGVGGVLTFKNAKKLKEVVAYMPVDRLLLETDCPYMAPTPHRGERNSSVYLPLVVKAVSEIKGIPEEEVVAATEANARRMYRIA